MNFHKHRNKRERRPKASDINHRPPQFFAAYYTRPHSSPPVTPFLPVGLNFQEHRDSEVFDTACTVAAHEWGINHDALA